MYGHQVSSDEESSEEGYTHRSNHQSDGETENPLESSRVVFAIQTVLESDQSDDGAGVVGSSTTTTSSSDIASELMHQQRYSMPALRSARGPLPPESEPVDVGRLSALERARRASSTHENSLPFVSIYVDELPMGPYIALFFERSNLSVKLNKHSKLFFAVELYNARHTSDDLEQYDGRMAKVPPSEMVYHVDCISMEQMSIKRVASEDTVDVWFEMSSSDESMYIRVAATYTTSNSRIVVSLVAVECRLMHDVDTVVAYRSFGENTTRHQRLPSIFFTPQLFENEAPRIVGCIPSTRKNKVVVALWGILRTQASRDWEKYVEVRESFVQDYSSLVDRGSKAEAVPAC